MTVRSTPAALTATLLLAACGGTDNDLIGPGATFGQALLANNALEDRVDDIRLLEDETLIGQLPTDGIATYHGIVNGYYEDGSPDGPPLDHFADLTLQTNFNSDQVTGSVRNMVTDLAGFQNPTGTVNVTGTIFPNGGLADLQFSGTGTFQQGSNITDYSIATTSGTFVGDTAQAASGTHLSTFVWTNGLYDETTSFSDGDWNVER